MQAGVSWAHKLHTGRSQLGTQTTYMQAGVSLEHKLHTGRSPLGTQTTCRQKSAGYTTTGRNQLGTQNYRLESIGHTN